MQRKHPPVKAGDIIGFSGSTWRSAGINLATYGIPYWDLSHIGIMAEVTSEEFPRFASWNVLKFPGGLLLFESLIECNSPCTISGKIVRGTQAHPLRERINACKGRIWHYPLWRELRPLESRRLTWFLLNHINKPYDEIGAFRAGGMGFSLIESWLRKADLSSIFCSEQCAGAHDHIGIFQTSSVSKWSPNFFVRAERKHGILQKPWRLR